MTISIRDIHEAQERIYEKDVVRRTPLKHSRTLSEVTDADVHLKMEHLQRTGSFKTRGAYNKLRQVARSDPKKTQAIAASAGNHAQGVALAAQQTDLEATIVMPKNAPQAKINATKGYGADVVIHGQNFQEAMAHAKSLVTDEAVFVHAYDDPAIMAGQGTIGMELYEQLPEADTIVVPIGGGGLIGGISTAVAKRFNNCRVIGVQGKGASTVPQSLQKGQPYTRDEVQTVADGLATGGIAELTYKPIDEYVDRVVVVSDSEISESILFMLERTKQMIEGAGVTSIAAIRRDTLDITGETVIPILSGGNLSMTDLQTVLTDGLTSRGQRVRLRVQIIDEPGRMGDISKIIGGYHANIHEVDHVRSKDELEVGEAYLDFQIQTSGENQTQRIMAALQKNDYTVQRLT